MALASCQSSSTEPAGPGREPDIFAFPMEPVTDVAWSALGDSRIAFHRTRDSGRIPGIVILDGVSDQASTFLGGTYYPEMLVSPAGQEVVFEALSRERGDDRDLFVVGLNGANLRSVGGLGPDGGSENFPGWDWSGGRVVFQAAIDFGGIEIRSHRPVHTPGPGDREVIYETDGTWWAHYLPVSSSPTGAVALTNQDPFEDQGLEGVWVFSEAFPAGRRVYLPEAAPGRDVQVLATSWAPDGRQLAFIETESAGPEVVRSSIQVVDTETLEVRQVVSEPSTWFTGTLCWTRDGERLVFIRVAGERETHLYTVPATGGSATQLTSEPLAIERNVSCLEPAA